MKRKSLPNRRFRIADQIQRDLAQIIVNEIKDPRLTWVTIMSVEVSNDLAHAKVYFSMLQGNQQEASQILNQSANFIRSILFKRLHIHTVPVLNFVYDETVEKAAYLDSLINQALDSSSQN